jgi:peroxiredoxin/uncharacterized membrane protein YphA (DoxX/SURF4 family)
MDTALLLARLLLAGVFAVSGVAKLADRPGSRKALKEFGVPAQFVGPGAIALPLVEFVVAALLLPRATAWWGAVGSLGLLLAFIAGIAYNLAQGRTPDCHCFGQLSAEPIGWRTLARDAVLAAAAGFVLVGGWGDPGHSAVAWLSDLPTGETVAVVLSVVAVTAVAVQGWLLVHLLRQNGRLLLRLDAVEARLDAGLGAQASAAAATPVAGLAVGTAAPPFQLDGLHGETMTLEALRAAGRPVLLVFSDPKCGPCNALMPELGRWQREYANRLAIAVIGRGTVEANRAKAVEHGLTNVLLQRNGEVAEAYKAKGTPSAVLVRDDGTIGSPVAAGVEAIRQLVNVATRIQVPVGTGPAAHPASAPNGKADRNDAVASQPPAEERGSRIGSPAPEITLPDLAGKTITLRDFLGSPTLVLFWNPSCGYCQRMTDELKAWEIAPPSGAPRLFVVSTGTVEANAAVGLRSTVVLDQGFATGRAFGATATPSAVLVDADGMIVSDVLVGATKVMALANGQDPRTIPADPPTVPAAPQISFGPAVERGQPAPPVKLKDLDGKLFDLAKHKAWPLALLFWDPDCRYCQWIVDPLKEWEENPPADEPRLVVVSLGSIEANREFGFRSRVLLDEEYDTRRAYGAAGTPSAVLIDSQRVIASDLVVGGNAVLDLIGYVPAVCRHCVDECRQRGGGDACRTVCQMSGQCPQDGESSIIFQKNLGIT